MGKRVCPWWLGYFLLCPLRRFREDPARILAPYVREGMKILEPGPGMGFFTIQLARMVGFTGHIVAVDIQPKMAARLKQRLARAGLADRVEIRVCSSNSLELPDSLAVDLTLAFAMVHELRDQLAFFKEVAKASNSGALVLLCEPKGHVTPAEFEDELRIAQQTGLQTVERPNVAGSHAALLKKTALSS